MIKKNFIFIFSIILTIVISTYLWRFIKFPYQENGIIGNYSSNQYNAINDIFRYIIFLSLPTIVYLFFKISYEKKKIIDILNYENDSTNCFFKNALPNDFQLNAVRDHTDDKFKEIEKEFSDLNMKKKLASIAKIAGAIGVGALLGL